MLSQDVRLSVRRTFYRNGETYNQTSSTILVFPHQTVWQYSDGGVECRRYEKNRDFWPMSRTDALSWK